MLCPVGLERGQSLLRCSWVRLGQTEAFAGENNEGLISTGE